MTIHDDDALASGPHPGTEVDPPATLDKRRRGVRVTYVAAVALGLAIGGGAVAGAASGSTSSTTPTSSSADGPGGHFGFGGTPPAAFGTVASVGANSFTVTTHDGTKVTVDVSGTTTYVDSAVTTPSLADVKAGDHVAVFGTDTAGTVTATKVAVGGPGAPGRQGGTGGPGGHFGFGGTPPAAFGTVASVGANSFTVTTHDGTKVTVDVSGTTTYVDSAVTTPSLADVKAGDHVAVFGTDTAGTVTATKVAVGGPDRNGHGGPGDSRGFGGTPPAASGTVDSVGTNTFTLSSPDGTKVSVDVGSSTTYTEFGKTSASIADVTVGAHVAVFGTDTANTVTATKVGIGSPTAGPDGRGGPGGPDGMHGPDGSGVWAPSSSTGTSSTGTSSTGGAITSSGSTLN